MLPLAQALERYVEAGWDYEESATAELLEKVLALFPDAHHIEVVGIMEDGYSEHDISVIGGDGKRLDEDYEWDDDWILEVAEGVCVFESHRTVYVDMFVTAKEG